MQARPLRSLQSELFDEVQVRAHGDAALGEEENALVERLGAEDLLPLLHVHVRRVLRERLKGRHHRRAGLAGLAARPAVDLRNGRRLQRFLDDPTIANGSVRKGRMQQLRGEHSDDTRLLSLSSTSDVRLQHLVAGPELVVPEDIPWEDLGLQASALRVRVQRHHAAEQQEGAIAPGGRPLRAQRRLREDPAALRQLHVGRRSDQPLQLWLIEALEKQRICGANLPGQGLVQGSQLGLQVLRRTAAIFLNVLQHLSLPHVQSQEPLDLTLVRRAVPHRLHGIVVQPSRPWLVLLLLLLLGSRLLSSHDPSPGG
mmetsp:Transcript_123268/g.307833  ORF Transcript_123268/g.307833 Transcript_123268/m.307833 type:complete len:313 (+) Transcript_123268:540-1478(+)